MADTEHLRIHHPRNKGDPRADPGPDKIHRNPDHPPKSTIHIIVTDDFETEEVN